MIAKQAGYQNLSVLALVLASCCIAQTAKAQAVFPQSQGQPSHPRLSPYLDLLRNDDSALPPYYSFVLPRQAMQQQQARQSLAIGQLQASAGAGMYGNQLGSVDSGRLTTGGGGSYQNYSHYYPSFAGPGQTSTMPFAGSRTANSARVQRGR